MKSVFESMGGTYTQSGDYYIPDITLPEGSNRKIGKYGRMRHWYLKEHRPVLYSTMILNGTLWDHLAEIDLTCNHRLDVLIAGMQKNQDISEALKARDPMAWVGGMNNIRSSAEEIILRELVYEEDWA
nr:TnpV protein [Oscillospiraceae bacterium]